MARPTSPRPLHLGVDLSDAGAHPAAWRTHGSQAQRLFDAERLQQLVDTAQRGTLDLVVIDDSFSLQPTRTTTLRGRLDAALVAARLAPRSRGIGLVPTVATTHTEPFHVSKAIATIDHVSGGRAGWQLGWSADDDDARDTAHFGRRPAVSEAAAVAEAEEAVRAVAALWDSWEDDAEIRDEATHRFVDRSKLHYVEHDGVHFAVKGPSITPRPPQGRPPVVVRVRSDESFGLAARHADVVRISATTRDEALDLRLRLRAAAVAAGREPGDLRVLADAFAVTGPDEASARARLDLLTELDGVRWDTDSLTHVGTARKLTDTFLDWWEIGAVDGFVVRPSSLHTDLDALVDGVVPMLRTARAFREHYAGPTLRDQLGLARPANRFAAIA
ncbi:LLM class flavin-dependent oxidoreductase [Cellulomonas xylanilytica]|uniref:FMNH2-utilizing oxygenase n=1 Tax=Cellulomonas xylanilytica TaxID=233583 RepID=A0A510V2K1_9CELL|nr:LLM class flavin-dependent oxidoreductase [Cellulomonas xylanilytica]GEK21104.1 FMNH2-utilizing oxygenase [Cellulomonas xylanilytica]